VVVIDRDLSYGNEGALYTEVRGALYGLDHSPTITNYIAGLGGADVTIQDIQKVVQGAIKVMDATEHRIIFQFMDEDK
jgi:pyruvate/2-oxoacid:ferredoxin oxidoreductase alpha subunit